MSGGGNNTTISTSEQALGALRVQTSSYGYSVPIVHGKTRITANMIWYGDFTAIPHTTTTSSGGGGGGKGGGGGSTTSTNTTYTYAAAVALALCEGPINSVTAVWAGKEQSTIAALGLTLFTGSYPQSNWGYLTTNHPSQVIPYQGTAYLASGAYQLGNSDSLPNHSFEVDTGMGFSSGNRDVDPSVSFTQFITNAHYGACPSGFTLGSTAQWSNYCVANGIFLSPAMIEQKQASEYVKMYSDLTNSEFVFSEGVLKIIPYGDTAITGNGVTFTPNNTPVYNLTDDDFLPGSGDPIIIKRKTPADAFNQVQLEFLNRGNQYNPEPAEAKDQGHIEQYGLLPAPMVTGHWIVDAAVANKIAQIKLQRSVYVRNTYEFKLGWKYCLLEPMDIVTIADPIGLVQFQVRILEIGEDEHGELSLVVEEMPYGVAHPALFDYTTPGGYAADYNSSPGNATTPTFFEPPFDLVHGVEIWMAAAGGSNWSGCEVWLSADDVTYKRAGVLNGPSRYGVLNSILTTHVDPDPAGSFAVDLTISGAALLSGTQADADANRTLCYVDGEFISYVTATLTAINKYTLTSLRRGAYGSPINSHLVNSKFVRCDDALLKYQVPEDMVYKTIYVKLPSFNKYGGGIQSIADVSPFAYTVTGAALLDPLPNVTGLVSVYQNDLLQLAWQPVADSRAHVYEVRKGASFATAEIIATTAEVKTSTSGDGTYWVVARAGAAYSTTPASLTVTGSSLPSNVIETHDEAATNWGRFTVSGSANNATYFMISGPSIDPRLTDGDSVVIFDSLTGPGHPAFNGTWVVSNSTPSGHGSSTFDIPLVDANYGVPTHLRSAAVLTNLSVNGVNELVTTLGGTGTFEAPLAHEIDVGTEQLCNCAVSYTFRAGNPNSLISTVPVFSALTSVAGNYAGQATCQIQINIAPNSGTYNGWQDFTPGQYIGRLFKFRAILAALNSEVIGVLAGLTSSVDVPDRTDTGTNIAIAVGGTAITYATPFHATPNVQITILNSAQGDTVQLNPSASTGFTVKVLNGGVGVVRNINWHSKGY